MRKTFRIENAGGDLIDSRGDGRGEDAVRDEHGERGGVGVDAEELEGGSDEQRIERRQPGCRTGGAVEGIGVSLPKDQGAGNAAGFKAEVEVVHLVVQPVGVADEDDGNAQQEPGPEDDPGGMESTTFRACCGLLLRHICQCNGAHLGLWWA
jgi:hypothetical protein